MWDKRDSRIPSGPQDCRHLAASRGERSGQGSTSGGMASRVPDTKWHREAGFTPGRDGLRRVRSSGALLLGDQVGSSELADTRSRRPHVAVCSCDPSDRVSPRIGFAARPRWRHAVLSGGGERSGGPLRATADGPLRRSGGGGPTSWATCPPGRPGPWPAGAGRPDAGRGRTSG